MKPTHHDSAERLRSLLSQEAVAPPVFRAALEAVPATERDGWLDLLFGLGELPDDGPKLPAGGVPYLPCPVDALLRMVDQAGVGPSDVFVDVGSGLGRAAALVHLLTGAAAIGVEIQPALVAASRQLGRRLKLSRFSTLEGDAAQLTGSLESGSVFFLYCPFSGDRLQRLLSELEAIARTREIRVSCVDLPLPPCPWLTLDSPPDRELAVYRSLPVR